MGILYVAVVQEMLLFGSETWVLNPRLEKACEGFHHRAVRRMVGMGPKLQRGGRLVYPPIGAVLVMVGLEESRVYIYQLQNMVAQYIATFPIMDFCLAAERNPGMPMLVEGRPVYPGDKGGACSSGGMGGILRRNNQRERESRVGKDEGGGIL